MPQRHSGPEHEVPARPAQERWIEQPSRAETQGPRQAPEQARQQLEPCERQETSFAHDEVLVFAER
jgi:hypothetical protein